MGNDSGRNGETRSLGESDIGGSSTVVRRARTTGRAARRLLHAHPRALVLTMATALIPLGSACSLSLADEAPEVLRFCYATDGDGPPGAAEASPAEPCLPSAQSCPRTRSAGLAAQPTPNCQP